MEITAKERRQQDRRTMVNAIMRFYMSSSNLEKSAARALAKKKVDRIFAEARRNHTEPIARIHNAAGAVVDEIGGDE